MQSQLLTITPQENFNWIGLDIHPPKSVLQAAQEFVFDLSKKGAVVHSIPGEKGEDPHHITVEYGSDKKDFEKIKERVLDAKISSSDIEFGKVYSIEPPHLKEKGRIIVAADLKCKKLDALKAALYKEFTIVNPAEADGRVIPWHLTLAQMTNAEHAKKAAATKS
jgi:hypothetical protein